jgi:hypothetical protein
MNQIHKNDAEELYDRIRAKIEHEDNLVNQRLMWMITLHGLLFTAYGFSLSAEANSLTAPALALGAAAAQMDAYKAFCSTITTLRHGMIFVGIGSSFAALFGVVAACRAIRDDERSFKSSHKKPPGTVLLKPIGRRFTNVLGMACCLSIPLLGAGVWTWIGGLIPNLLIVAIGLIMAVMAFLTLLPFVPMSQDSHSSVVTGEMVAEAYEED